MMRRKDEEAGNAAFSGVEPVISGRDPQVGVLKVRFSPLSMAFLCFTVISTAPAWAGSLGTALYAGGPVTMIFGYLIVAVCSLCGAASMAELVSIWPTAEGQIAWTETMAPEFCAGILVGSRAWLPRSGFFGTTLTFGIPSQRYWVAWLTCSGWIALTMSAKFICALGVSLGSVRIYES